MADWIIQQASLSDAPDIAKFQVEMAKESEDTELDYELVLRGVTEGLNDNNKGTYLVARNEEGRAIASLLITREWSDWRCGWYLWIQSVFVTPEYRRKGVYRAMYQKVKTIAAGSQSPCVRLYVDKGNVKGLSTYKSLGMKESHYLLYEEDI